MEIDRWGFLPSVSLSAARVKLHQIVEHLRCRLLEVYADCEQANILSRHPMAGTSRVWTQLIRVNTSVSPSTSLDNPRLQNHL